MNKNIIRLERQYEEDYLENYAGLNSPNDMDDEYREEESEDITEDDEVINDIIEGSE